MPQHLSFLPCFLLLFSACSHQTSPGTAQGDGEPVGWVQNGVQTAPSLAEPASQTLPGSAAGSLLSQKGTDPFNHVDFLELSLQVEGGTAAMSVVSFDSRHCTLRVIDQPEAWSFGDTLGNAMRSAGAIAGVNGGYFRPDFTPLGLMIANGKTQGQFTRSSLVSGMLRVRQGEPSLIWNSESSSTSNASDLLQAGPRLVDRGLPVAGLNASKVAARTFLATDGKHRWLVGVVRDTTLAGLAKLLATPNLISGMRVHRALNLDGGRSTAFYARTSDGREISQPGWSTVRNYVAVVPR